MSFFRYPDYINCHVSLLTWLFICCDSDSLLLGTHLKMSTTGDSTEDLLRQLIARVDTLTKDVDDLKTAKDERPYPQKRQRNGDSVGSHDGDLGDGRDSDPGEEENDGSHATQFSLSEAADAFLETTFNSALTYQDRKKQIAKYGEPDSRWTTCPSLAPVVAATLPGAAIKDDKVAFRTQQMYMEAVAPLAAFLESTDDENFTVKEAIPMVQSAIKLLGDATQHHSAIRRKAIMQHLNPQLQTLMKDEDFKGAQPLLFGEHFGEKAKARMEEAAALKKIVLPPKPKQSGFHKSHPQRHTGGHQGGKTRQYGPANKFQKKESGGKTSQGKS